jgi:hypothetical protein
MKKVNLIALALIAICLLAAPRALGQGGTVEQQITALSDQETAAYLKADTSFFEKYVADDRTAIHRDGKLSTKAQEIENLKSGTLKYEAIHVLGRQIRTYGDTAVVLTLSSSKGTLSGKSFSGDILSTRIFVKQKGSWKEVASQSTRVAPSQ